MAKLERREYFDKLYIAANQNIEERDYWLAKLSGHLERTHFPYDFFPGNKERIGEGTPDMDSVPFRFSDELFAKSMKLSGGNDLKFHMILAAALMALLQRYTGHENIMIGSPILKQDMEMEFVNTILVFRNRVEKHVTFKQLLLEVRETIVKAAENQNYPMEVLVDTLKLPVMGNESPLFDVVLLLENLHDKSYIDDVYRSMTFIFGMTDRYVEGVIRYDSRLYRPCTIQRISVHFNRVLEVVLADIDVPLGRINTLSQEEKEQLLTEFNQPLESPDLKEVQAQTLYQVFEKQVEESPHRIAVVHGNLQVTYRVLDEKADTLARLLRQKGVGPDVIAALWVPPSIEMMVGQLGIMKSGGAYLPIALDAPEQRVRFILEDSNVEILVSELSEASKVSEGIEVLDLSLPPAPCPLPPASPSNLAYIIYTSGTTGQPKGVMVEHRQVMAYLYAFYREFDIKPRDTVIQLAPYSFDVFIEEVYSLLLKGGKVIIPTQEQVLEMRHLSALVSRHQVSIIDCTPLLLNEFDKLNPDELSSVRLFINGGDILKEEYITNLSRIGTVYNTYGPTETTVCASYYKYTGPLRSTIPIGKPTAGYRVYILDKDYSLQPIGVAGEICIAGAGVTRGYLNRPELTAEKFGRAVISHSSLVISSSKSTNDQCPMTNDRLYRTGDLARWLADGNIEFLGRTDYQAKIRGYRIETGEIEHQLLKREEIKEAVVTPRESKEGEKYLCAYIVLMQTVEINSSRLASELRKYLLDQVPDYMVPSFFVALDRIPLNPSGKIDRKALPEPEVKSSREYMPPRSPVEERLVQIWQDVFGVEKIGVHDDFFDIGGHSLRGIRIANGVHKAFDVDIQLTEIFRRRTIENLAEYIKGAGKDLFISIKLAEEKEYYVLSSAQRRLYLLQRMVPDSMAYNMPQAIPIGESIDRGRLEQAFKQLIQRHESLRTSFEMVGQEPVQRIHENVSFKIEYFDSRTGKEQTIRPFPFDFSKPPLFRAGLIKERGNYTLLVDMHHIVTDGVSMGILAAEFAAIYSGQSLPELRLQYKDYAQWQNSDRQKVAVKKQGEYWLRRCEGELPVLDLPIDYPRPLMQSFEGSSTSFSLGQKEVDGLKEVAVGSGATLYMMVLALYNLLLSKLSGQEDIIVGAVIAGRSHADLQDIIGMFVNTLAMRNYPSGKKPFVDFLEEVKQNTAAAYGNQDYPFEDLVENLPVKRDTGRNPVFDVVFNWVNREEQEFQQQYNPEASSIGIHQPGTAKFDFILSALEAGNEMVFAIEYCTKLFKPEIIERFIGYFEKIVNAVVENPQVRISEIEILGEEEKNQLLFEFNRTASEYPKDKTIHQLFEEQAEKRPDSLSVVGKGERTGEVVQLTSRELDKKSDQLAYMLIERGVLADDIVAIMMERSIEMIIVIMGILKAGGAYLPIELDYPAERIAYMLTDSNARVLVSELSEVSKVGKGIEVIEVNSAVGNRLACSAVEDHLHLSPAPSTSLAYIIYTSGTTGKPKGILTTHRNAVRVVKNTNYIELTEKDRVLQLSNYAFDGSVFDIYGALLNGAVLVMIEKEDVFVLARLAEVITRERVTVFFITTALFNALVDLKIECLAGIAKVLFGGEKVSVSYSRKALEYLGKNRIIHVYGPTETTVYATYYFIDSIDETRSTIPIGGPIANTTIYVLDCCLEPVPVGVTGELYIGGDGVARGYLNTPELTAEKFIDPEQASLFPTPYSPTHPLTHSTIYRTGDLARWLPDGNVEFLGRIDQQVKIRGFRIELEEIESHLLETEGIDEATVIAREDKTGQKYLCGYIVSKKEMDIQAIENALSGVLPAYMIPAYFVQLDNMPLTPNGKIDRKTLPMPETKLEETYMAPGNETEEKMVEIWSEVLGIKKEVIGIHDDFFKLGGNSLKLTILAAKIHEGFQVDLPLGKIFQIPTIKGICALISVAGWVENPEVSDNSREYEETIL